MRADDVDRRPTPDGRIWIPIVVALALGLVLPSDPQDPGGQRAFAQGPTFTPTPTNTPVLPTATATPTPTNTPVLPTATATPTPTNTPALPTATATPTPTGTPAPPSPTPTPGATAEVGLSVTTAVPGQPLFASGMVPDTSQSYTLCLVPNAAFTPGDPFTGTCLLQQPLTSPTNAFSGVPLGPAPGPGTYDLLLLDSSGTILAAQDASAAAGLLVTAGSVIPVGGRAGLIGFAFLVAAAAWILLRQFR